LVGLIAFAIVIVVLVVYAIEGCQSSSKHAKYEHYMSKVAQIASHSQTVGRQLTNVLTTPGVKTTDLQRRLAGLARDEEQDADAARGIDPPGHLRTQHERLIDALQYRYSGIVGLADSLTQALKTKNSGAGALLEVPAQRLLASDVVWDDSFKDPAKQVLRSQGVGDIRVPDSNFVQSPDFFASSSLASVLGRLRGGNVTPKSGGLHGTNIVSVKALPRGTELSTQTQTPVVASSDLTFAVTIEDSGDSVEVRIPVTLTIEQTPKIVKRQTLQFISAKQQKTVFFRNIGTPEFTTPVKIKVNVAPVPGEHNESNNTAEYPVIFTLAQ
jgi:hypothetical protein